MGFTGSFRHSVWDPALIVSQIIGIQSIMYFFMGISVLIMHFIVGANVSLDFMFKISEMNVRDSAGRSVVAVFLLIALFNSCTIWALVRRTKLCLDFAVTIHCLHLLLSWSYSGYFPRSAAWWVCNILCVAVTCVCAEFLCMKSELKAIPLGSGSKVDL